MPADQFWDLTPAEINSIIIQGAKRNRRDFETQCHVMKVAINSVLSKKDQKPFKTEAQAEVKSITIEEREAQIAYLKEKFNF